MEENKKGQNTLYAVIGVATLVVAIIGATFAYFSAQAVATGDPIAGETNDVGGALSLTVTRLNFFDEGAEDKPDSDKLIPADLGLAGSQPTATELNGILGAKCVDGSYTGCHLYKISAHATQALSAKLLLQNFTVDAKDKASWSYIVFKGSDTTEESITSTASASDAFAPVVGTFASTDNATHPDPLTENDTIRGKEIDNNIIMEAYSDDNPTENVYDYYLLIYLANKDAVQNNKDDETNNGVGQYSGSVLLDAGDGSGLVASFNHS